MPPAVLFTLLCTILWCLAEENHAALLSILHRLFIGYRLAKALAVEVHVQLNPFTLWDVQRTPHDVCALNLGCSFHSCHCLYPSQEGDSPSCSLLNLRADAHQVVPVRRDLLILRESSPRVFRRSQLLVGILRLKRAYNVEINWRTTSMLLNVHAHR